MGRKVLYSFVGRKTHYQYPFWDVLNRQVQSPLKVVLVRSKEDPEPGDTTAIEVEEHAREIKDTLERIHSCHCEEIFLSIDTHFFEASKLTMVYEFLKTILERKATQIFIDISSGRRALASICLLAAQETLSFYGDHFSNSKELPEFFGISRPTRKAIKTKEEDEAYFRGELSEEELKSKRFIRFKLGQIYSGLHTTEIKVLQDWDSGKSQKEMSKPGCGESTISKYQKHLVELDLLTKEPSCKAKAKRSNSGDLFLEIQDLIRNYCEKDVP